MNNVKSGDVFEFTMRTKNSLGYSLFSGGTSYPSPPPRLSNQSTKFSDPPGRVTAFGPPYLTGI
jgi:hypothetical protein